MELVAVGVAAGVLSGLVGIGGGVVIVSALIMVAKFQPEMATGTSLAALLLPVGALGAWHSWRHGFVDLRAAEWIALGLFLGAWLGVNVALRLPVRDLQWTFAVFLVFVAGHLWWTA